LVLSFKESCDFYRQKCGPGVGGDILEVVNSRSQERSRFRELPGQRAPVLGHVQRVNS
jgi:hypothetical protein